LRTFLFVWLSCLRCCAISTMHSLHQHRTAPLPFQASKQCPAITKPYRALTHDRQVVAEASHHRIHDHTSRSSTSTTSSTTTTKRQLGLSAAALTAATAVARVNPCFASPEDAAAADVLSQVPRVQLAQNAAGLEVSRVIKGCWQLSGGHKGDKQTDRTGGEAAVRVSCSIRPCCCRGSPNKSLNTAVLRKPAVLSKTHSYDHTAVQLCASMPHNRGVKMVVLLLLLLLCRTSTTL
jgi:hypothetical protein